jgi:hypothetical protein
MPTSHQRLGAAILALATAACGAHNVATAGLPRAGPEGYAIVQVENDNIRDMRIYVRPHGGAQRFRLGTANGMETTVLKIPRTMTTGVTELVFEISPIAGGGSAFSQKITVNQGEAIELRIPPD